MRYTDRHMSGFVRMNAIAVLSVIALLVVIAWTAYDSNQQKKRILNVDAVPVSKILSQQGEQEASSNTDVIDALANISLGPADPDPIASMSQGVMAQLAGNYIMAKQDGSYTAQKGTQIGTDLATSLKAPVSFDSYSEADVHTTTNTSYSRMIQYRTDLQASLAPLLENTRSEFEIYGQYVQTKDPQYLDELRRAAHNYKTAASSTRDVIVPIDAVSYHVGIMRAMLEFAATLEAMADHANDPIASAALLRTYNQAEQDMMTSFNTLAQYYVHKKQ